MKTNIPRLRFIEFKEDPVWEEKKLGEVCQVISGGTPSTSIPEYWNGDFIWITPSEMKDKYLHDSRRKITELGMKKSSAKLLPRGTIIYSTRASIGLKGILMEEATTNQGFQNLVPNDNIDNEFIYYLDKIDKEAKKRSSGSTFDEVSGNEIRTIPVNIPKFKEQEKIGMFLSTLDRRIELQEKLIEKLVEEKKGYLQKLFPKKGKNVPELRFNEFKNTVDWEEKKLSMTNTFYTDGNYGELYPTEFDFTTKENGVPFLRGTELNNGVIDLTSSKYITREKHEQLTSGHLMLDDIIIAVRGSLGSLGYVTKEYVGSNINSQLAIIRTNKTELLGLFLLQQLLSRKNQNDLASLYTGSALKQLPIKNLKELVVTYPSANEQDSISNMLASIDCTIQNNLNVSSSLKKSKEYYLSNLIL